MSGQKITDLRTLSVGDRFTIKQGPLTRTMRVTAKDGDEITAVWDPASEQERAAWDAVGWGYAREAGWL